FEKWKMPGGPAMRLVKFAKEYKDKKLRLFFLYKTKKDLNEVLSKYKIISEDITHISQFTSHNEIASEFKLCIDDIFCRIKNMEPVVDSNKAMHCEHISTILHIAVSLLDSLVITSQINVIEENTNCQTQDIINLQNVCSIEVISSDKVLLKNKDIDAFLNEEYKKKVNNTSSEPFTSLYFIFDNSDLSEQNAKIKAPEIDIQPLIQELLIEPSKEDCVKIVNVEESPIINQSSAIEL
ncbi:4061_t:CDS:2, partial [Cetraspora pellucida]